MSSREELSLKQTTVNRPQLYHSSSKQSISASEDYYSASEGPSSESDGPSYGRPLSASDRHHFSTPPTQRTPDPETAQSRSVRPLVPAGNSRSKNVTFDSSVVERGAATGSDLLNTNGATANTSVPRRPMPARSPSTTPGLDDTPYIHFAIDQLTRDEEVRGSRFYQGIPEENEDSYPVERRIPDEGLGYFGGPNQPISPAHPSPQGSDRTLLSENGRRSIPNSPRLLPRLPGPIAAANNQRPPAPSIAITAASDPTPPPIMQRDFVYPKHQRTDSDYTEATQRDSVQKDIFVPHRPGRDSLRYPPLDFLPGILRPVPLLAFFSLCSIVLAALIFCAVYSLTNHGLWMYTGFGGARYFVFRYLPQTIGMLVLLWLFQIQTAIQRVAPYIALASESGRDRSHGVFLELSPLTFLLPNIQYFRAGQTIFGIFSTVSWLFLFTIPLLASSFNTHHEGPAQAGYWTWTAVQGVIWSAIALYAFLVLAVLILLFYLRRRQTGLKWDPRSLADILALLERSNVVNEYEGSETFESRQDFQRTFSDQAPLLGYWHTSKRQTDVFYGLGEPGHPTRRYSIEDGKIREKAPEKVAMKYPLADTETTPRSMRREGDFSIRMDIRSSKIRLRYLPWYLRDSFVAAWVVIAVVLMVAFLVISFVNDAILSGFDPRVQAEADADGFSAANFLYSILPCAIGMVLFLSWQSLDLSFRALAPYAALSARQGATAERSLLLDYASRLPVSVTVVAAANGHYAVAVLSFFSLINAAVPILAGGVFWSQFFVSTRSVRVTAHMPGYYALCVFVALYAVFISVIFTNRRRMALPHASNSLAEVISWVYQSPILTDRAFSRPATKADMVTRLMGAGWTDKSTFSRSLVALVSPSRQNLAEQRVAGSVSQDRRPSLHGTDPDETDVDVEREGKKQQNVLDPASIRYGFGIYVGRDGTEHLGVDRVKRGTGREIVLYEETRR